MRHFCIRSVSGAEMSKTLRHQFCVTAVIITKICTISTYKRSIILCSLNTGECIYRTMTSCSARLHSSFLDQTDSDTASDTGVCDHKHMQLPHPIAREKASSVVTMWTITSFLFTSPHHSPCRFQFHHQMPLQRCLLIDWWLTTITWLIFFVAYFHKRRF